MSFYRGQQFRSQSAQASSSKSQFLPRPLSIQAPKCSLTQEDRENEAFNQNKFEASGLRLKEKHGTIEPIEQKKLGVLQFKMDSLWARRMNRAKAQPNLVGIPVHNIQSPLAEPAALVPPKVTVRRSDDQYEQKTDRFSEQMMSMASPATLNIQRQTEKSKSANLIQMNDGSSIGRTITPLIQRKPVPEKKAQPANPVSNNAQSLPSADELTKRIARCIGVWETNRGRANPAPKESGLDTVAGVHASMATIEQATMPYAITALKKHKSLRAKAIPPLKMTELNRAEARVKAVKALLKSITQASAEGKTPDDLIKNNTKDITATGLSNSDVKTMFNAVKLRTTLNKALTDANSASKIAREKAQKEKKTHKQQVSAEKTSKKKSVQGSIDAIPAAERLGLRKGSLRTYINRPKTWGENRAGWQRKAVSLMPDNIGSRIESVATLDNGTALAIPVVGARVKAELAKKPVPSLENLVKTVAQRNNPGETNYGKHVWETYKRLFPQNISGE